MMTLTQVRFEDAVCAVTAALSMWIAQIAVLYVSEINRESGQNPGQPPLLYLAQSAY